MPRRIAALIVFACFAALLPAGAGSAGSSTGVADVPVVHTGPDYNDGRALPLVVEGDEALGALETYSSSAGRNDVGDRRYWFALDDATQQIYPKRFTLRGKGRHVEVWVTPNLRFPEGDCRNDERVRVTDRQVNYLVRQFDDNVYPKMSRAFSRPPDRNGRNATGPGQIGVSQNYYRGDGDNIVVLVDNVRDGNYYDFNNAGNEPYIIGFFYSPFNTLTDRNVMTVDGYDWIHRTRANPPDEPVPGDLCESKPARPFLIEETLAHEYQHLLMEYEDSNEKTWLNEGLSDWAQTLTGYAHPERGIDELGFDRHVQCFLGFCGVQTPYNPNPSDTGPENSLTVWEDQPPDEILAEYGASYTFMELLASRFGRSFMKKLHTNNRDGLPSLKRVLRATDAGTSVRQVVADWAATVAVDKAIDEGAVLQSTVDPADVTARRLSAEINWSTTHAYSTPGAPPNGSDFVRLRDNQGDPVAAASINSIEFDGTPVGTNGRFTLQLVAFDATSLWLARIPLDANSDAALSAEDVQAAIGTTAQTVAAIVTFHAAETLGDYAPYRLEVDNVLQPGGS